MSCGLKLPFRFHHTQDQHYSSRKSYILLPEDVPLKQTDKASIILVESEDKVRVSGVLKKLEKFSLHYVVTDGNHKHTT